MASRPCLVCGRKPADPHHLRFAQARAFGRKVSGKFTVPLCRLHHRELHRARNETGWWSKLGIDALATALKLWKLTRSGKEVAATATGEPASAPAQGIAVPAGARIPRARQRLAVAEPKPTGSA